MLRQKIFRFLVSKHKPRLIVIGGCNGSGKSTFSKSLMSEIIVPFDYDKCFMDIYRSKPDSELRERITHNLAFEELEESVRDAISNETGFFYEPNFNSDPMHWPEVFKEKGYQVDMFYFCLDSIAEAKKRV